MAPNKFSLLLVLYVTVSCVFNPSKVDAALVDDVCKQTSDPTFCLNVFHSDHRTAAATDLPRLALLSISISNEHVENTIGKIDEISRGITDPTGKQRINVCRKDYQHAWRNFRSAYSISSNRAYWDVLDIVRKATNDVMDCQNIYRRSAPISESPISGDNLKLVKFSGIILTVVSMLVRN